MDWYSNDNTVVKGHGRGAKARVADCPYPDVATEGVL